MECNISTLKRILYQENKRYYDYTDKSKMINSDISIIDSVLALLMTDDYKVLYSNLMVIELSLNGIFDSDLIEKRLFKLEESALICRLSLENKVTVSDLRKARRNINSLILFLKNEKQRKEVELLNIRPNISSAMVDLYNEIIFTFKNGLLVSSFYYEMISKLFDRMGMPDKEQIEFFEAIRKHNNRVHLKENKQRIDYMEENKTLDMINAGYEWYTVPSVGRNRIGYLKSEIDMYLNILNGSEDLDEVIGFFPLASEYDKNELIFIIFNILNNLQRQMNDLSNFIIKKENYLEKEIRGEAINEFYNLQKKFRTIRKYLEEQLSYYETHYEENQNVKVNDIYYLMHDSSDKSYIETDLKNIPQDLLNNLKRLILGLESDSLSFKESKRLSHYCAGYRELIDDQLIIIYKHIGDNKFLIIGTGIKKSNTDLPLYKNMASRKINENLLAPASVVQERLFDFIEKNRHYGGRTNA